MIIAHIFIIAIIFVHVLILDANGHENEGANTWISFFPSIDKNDILVQAAIFHHQNPESCEGKRFFYSLSHNWGHGSSMHMMSSHLGNAMEQNRIMIYDNNWVWADKERCKKNQINVDCYFLPLSKCQYELDMTEVAKLSKKLKDNEWKDNKDVKFITLGSEVPHAAKPNIPNATIPGYDHYIYIYMYINLIS
jgi:hypothetical protein